SQCRPSSYAFRDGRPMFEAASARQATAIAIFPTNMQLLPTKLSGSLTSSPIFSATVELDLIKEVATTGRESHADIGLRPLRTRLVRKLRAPRRCYNSCNVVQSQLDEIHCTGEA